MSRTARSRTAYRRTQKWYREQTHPGYGAVQRCPSLTDKRPHASPNHVGKHKPEQRERDGKRGKSRCSLLAARRLDGGVNRQRNGPRLAGDVRNERNDGAELAKARGKRRHQSCENSGHGKRQMQGQQAVKL